MLRTVLTVVQVFVSFGIIGLVLLQRGKGADAGAGFGAGASGTVFGARGARTALSRATAIFAFIFMANSLALAYMGQRKTEAPPSILDQPVSTNTPAPSSAPPPAVAPSSPAPASPQAPATGPENGAAPK
jgi:preprotein translocase subunit SecG